MFSSSITLFSPIVWVRARIVVLSFGAPIIGICAGIGIHLSITLSCCPVNAIVFLILVGVPIVFRPVLIFFPAILIPCLVFCPVALILGVFILPTILIPGLLILPVT